jgi:hypothetical protein
MIVSQMVDSLAELSCHLTQHAGGWLLNGIYPTQPVNHSVDTALLCDLKCKVRLGVCAMATVVGKDHVGLKAHLVSFAFVMMVGFLQQQHSSHHPSYSYNLSITYILIMLLFACSFLYLSNRLGGVIM